MEDAEAYRDEKYGMHFSVYRTGQLLQLTVIASEYAEDELRQLIALFRANVDALYRHTQASVGSMIGMAKPALGRSISSRGTYWNRI